MNTNHNRIKVSDLETNSSDQILITNSNGELEFSNIKNISYNALDYALEGKALDARQGKILKGFIDNINALLASDNANLNTVQELVDAIEAIQASLNTILVNDLTTGGAAKALSAEMGKVLQNNKVDKVAGKSLLSDSEITRLGTLVNYTHPTTHAPSIIAQDASNRFVSDAEKATWNAKQSALGFTPENISNKNAVNGYAGLGADGKLIAAQLPSIAIKNTFVTASQTAMLALIAETGDMAIRSDVNKSYVLKGTNPALINDWQELLTPPDAVTTVFGRNGAVVSQTGDYTADQISETASRKFQTANQNTFNDATSSIQTQLNSKQANIAAGTTSQYFRGDKSWQTLDKTAVGLANADNTSDAAKNVLSATKLTTARTINGVAFDGSANITINAVDSTARIASSEKGAANGVATLDASGIILTSQLPSYVDDVLEFTNLAGFPATGETGKIYIAKDTNKTYRWGGSAYVYITSGAVDSVAGKTGVVTLAKTDVGLGSVDNTADAAKNVLSATKLTTPRTINGVSFDGSANITITDPTKENSVTAGTASQYWRGDKTWQALTTANVPESGNLYFSNARSIASILTGYSSTPGTIAATDSILTAINKLNGNDVLKAPLASPSFTGTVTAPTFSGALTGNASTATILQTPRTINGVSFDGSANITITDPTKENSITAGTASQYWRGDKTWQALTTANVPESGNLYFSNARSIASILTGYSSTPGTIAATDSILTAINKLNGNDALKAPLASPTFTGTVTAPTFSGALTGNASTATILQTPRTINGVSFNGSANITIADSTKLPLIGGTMSGDIIFPGTDRSEGIFGTYDSTKTQSIWSMGTAYRNSIDGSNFGTLYGLAYKHTNNPSGGTMAGGHQMVWCSNGSPKSAIGDGIWTSGTITGDGSGLTGISQTFSIGGNAATATRLQTPRTINGVLFDGSANITIVDSSKAPLASPTFTGTVTAPTFVGNLNGNSTGFPFQSGVQLDNLSGSISTIAREEAPSSGYYYTSTLHMASGDGRQQLTISRDGSGMKFRGNTTASGTTGWTSWKTVLTDSNYAAYSAFSGAITGASLTVSGDVTAFSDARVKENIRPISNVIERIQASRGVVYDRIDNDQKNNIGFIAQELEENFPELVLTREDGTKAVKYQNAVAVLFEAVKKQQAQIEEQDKKMKLILEHLNLKL
ncbi:tail fiber domain-containing protein [Flavobacterium sp. LHD-85]|uniref:tail fiber domain-containing protein n=1 Tax=Flavobacterium sp. LHD-85 TaxID=3071410 RepID=UPI0027DF06F7|nr:tail fiber domain-containing protein [Flavobacterium sp. LHD-85]MDQ6531283.1 tail fiber domain-containing protein [Flavobacterium sp. LHD-85]